MISGEDYTDYSGSGEANLFTAKTIEHPEKVECVRLYGFNSSVSVNFNEYLHNIESPEETHLIIDLRFNSGGLTSSCNDMLDLLLPNCVTSYLVDRDGYISTYESNKYNLKFKHVFILVSEYTASAGEMFAISLQKYLDNATVVGTETYGKGVGQVVFVNRKSQYAIFLVGHYWNVAEQNIQNKSVIPDVVLEPGTDPLEIIKARIAEGGN